MDAPRTWNAKRISAELRRRGIARVSPAWVEALFDRQGVCAAGAVCTANAGRAVSVRGRTSSGTSTSRALTAYARYFNYHRLHGEIGWQTPAERYDGTPFTDQLFENIPSLGAVADHLVAVLRAA